MNDKVRNPPPPHAIRTRTEMEMYVGCPIYMPSNGDVNILPFDRTLLTGGILKLTVTGVKPQVIGDENGFIVNVSEKVSAFENHGIFADSDFGVRWGDSTPVRKWFFGNYWFALSYTLKR